MSVQINIQRESFVGTDYYDVLEYTAEAEVTHWCAGSIEDWDFAVYDDDGEKTDVRLTSDEIYRLFSKLNEDENGGSLERRYRYGG